MRRKNKDKCRRRVKETNKRGIKETGKRRNGKNKSENREICMKK